MDVVIVNPTFMLGAYDSKPSSGQIILMGYRKRVVFCPPGGKNFIHVADAAAAAVSALTQGVSGETYLLSGENLTYREFFGKLVGVAGNRPLCIVLPRPLLITVGYLGNLLQRAGISNRFTLANMRILCVGNYYTNAKAVEDLGLTTAPVEAAITDALQWFRHNGMVK